MKFRYSPSARRAHLAHLRAKYGKSAQLKPTPKDPFGFKAFFEQLQPEPVTQKGTCQVCGKPCLPGCYVHRECSDKRAEQPEPDPKPEQPIDCDCIRCQEERRAALPERKINFYGVPPCGHFLLFLPESQANEQHFCFKCQKTVAMESEAEHLKHVQQAEQERQERIKACAAALAALQPEKPEDSPTYTGQSDDAGNPLFSDAHMPEYVGTVQPEPRKCGLGWCHNEALDGYAVCAEHLPQQPEPAPKPEQPIDCDCPACEIERQRYAELERVFSERLINALQYERLKKQYEKDTRLGICQECGKVCVPGFLFHDECVQPEQYQSVTYYPETDVTVAIGPETPYNPDNWPQHLHADDCRCHLCWAASLDMPSPPWEGGAA